MWQRYPQIFTSSLVSTILEKEDFLPHLSSSPHSKSIIFYTIFKLFCEETLTFELKGLQALEMLIPSLKKDKFVKANESLYFNSLFSSYSDNFEKLPIKLKKPITSFLKTNLLFEITQYHDKLFNQVFEKSSK